MQNLRQVLECSNGACDLAALALEQALTDWMERMERARRQSGEFASLGTALQDAGAQSSGSS